VLHTTAARRRAREGYQNIAQIAPSLVLLFASCHKPAPAPKPAPPVLTTQARSQNVPITGEWVASFDGSNTAEIRPNVNGYVTSIRYTQGDFVKQVTLPRSQNCWMARND
jgi:multidrug efflux pump subunit AcrA (membrane-fusion protein)